MADGMLERCSDPERVERLVEMVAAILAALGGCPTDFVTSADINALARMLQAHEEDPGSMEYAHAVDFLRLAYRITNEQASRLLELAW